jgi:predicted nucleotidyltransferase
VSDQTNRPSVEMIIATLRTALPNLLAVYLFGSQASGHANSDSDTDLAILLDGTIEPMMLWNHAQQLATLLNSEVDLIDLRQASTVLQYQIITTGQRLWQADSQAAIFESFILSEKTALDTARAGILADIQQRGSVYGGSAYGR